MIEFFYNILQPPDNSIFSENHELRKKIWASKARQSDSAMPVAHASLHHGGAAEIIAK